MRTFSPRHVLVLALTFVLMLAGFGRGVMAAPEPAVGTIAGIAVSICHASADGAVNTQVPGAPDRHDCCDDGALCAAVVVPAQPVLPGPSSGSPASVEDTTAASIPRLAATHTPRLSQGPPAA